MLGTDSQELLWFFSFPSRSFPSNLSIPHSLIHSFIHKRKGIPNKAKVDFQTKGRTLGRRGKGKQRRQITPLTGF